MTNTSLGKFASEIVEGQLHIWIHKVIRLWQRIIENVCIENEFTVSTSVHNSTLLNDRDTTANSFVNFTCKWGVYYSSASSYILLVLAKLVIGFLAKEMKKFLITEENNY